MPTLTSPALPALRIEAAINDLMGKGEFLDHHVEHALASIDDHIANMIAKLEKREDKSESRIGDLESVSPPPAFFVPSSLDLTLDPPSLPPLCRSSRRRSTALWRCASTGSRIN
jgi:hypothetical protein